MRNIHTSSIIDCGLLKLRRNQYFPCLDWLNERLPIQQGETSSLQKSALGLPEPRVRKVYPQDLVSKVLEECHGREGFDFEKKGTGGLHPLLYHRI